MMVLRVLQALSEQRAILEMMVKMATMETRETARLVVSAPAAAHRGAKAAQAAAVLEQAATFSSPKAAH